MTLGERFLRWLVAELGDPSAPVPEEVAIERFRTLLRFATLPVITIIVATVLHAWEFPAVMAVLGIIGVYGGMKAPVARKQISDITTHSIWGASLITFVGILVLRLLASPSALSAIFGINPGASATDIYSELAPVVFIVGTLVVILYELRAVITEVRQVRSRQDTSRLILGMTRTRRNMSR